jgi:anti-anti-sigma regulatory factor
MTQLTREMEGERPVLRLRGQFDRASAWALRERLETEAAPELVVDFSLVRDFSDLAVAVLAHGVQLTHARIVLRGLRQHQLRIFRYCGVDVADGREALATPTPPPAHAPASH